MASCIESTRAVACVLCLSRIMYAPARRMSHRRTSPSAPPVANAYSFDRDHSIACTLPLCPDSVCAITFDAGSHNRTTSSSEPIATSECDVARALSSAARHLVASSVSVATLKQFASQHFTAPSYDPVKNTPVSDGNHRAHDVAYACPISSLVVASRVAAASSRLARPPAGRAPPPTISHTSVAPELDGSGAPSHRSSPPRRSVSYTRAPPSMPPTKRYRRSTVSRSTHVGATSLSTREASSRGRRESPRSRATRNESGARVPALRARARACMALRTMGVVWWDSTGRERDGTGRDGTGRDAFALGDAGM